MRLLAYVAQLPRYLLMMEACGGAHYSGREMQWLDQRIKLLKPEYVKAYVLGDKGGRRGAAAVAECGTHARSRLAAPSDNARSPMESIFGIRPVAGSGHRLRPGRRNGPSSHRLPTFSSPNPGAAAAFAGGLTPARGRNP
jgi:hypothetical protein